MYCANAACVIVTFDGDHVVVTDSKQGDASPTITYSRDEWARLTATILGGGCPTEIVPDGDGGVTWYDPDSHPGHIVSVEFDKAEWDAFEAGLVGELSPLAAAASGRVSA